MLLSDCIGAPVRCDGARVGALADLAAATRGAAPVVAGVLVRGRGWAPWGDVLALGPEGVELAGPPTSQTPPGPVRLARDVLDAQLVDVGGRRVVRVADVDLRVEHGLLHVVGVEVGLGSVLHRLGLRRLAARAPHRHVAWADIHLPSQPGGALILGGPPALAQLSPTDRARLAARLPARAAAALRVPRRVVPRRFPVHGFRRRRAAP